MINVVKNHVVEDHNMTDTYLATIRELMAENRDVVEVEADLGGCILNGAPNIWSLPECQIFDVGIQEANQVGLACGLSAAGKIPFAHTFATFMSRRANDQIFISGCYARSNVKLVGSDPGIMAAFNGGTHMPFEDVGALRAFQGLTILEPSDSVMLEDLMRQLVALKGMYYIRTARKAMTAVYEKGSSFEIGKGNIVRDGKDVTIIAAGIMVGEALAAAEKLAADGVDARVVDMFTIKPIDSELVVRCAKETGAIVTAENHSVINGLGSAVSEVLVQEYPAPVEMVGVRDMFGEVGPVDYLKKHFHLTADDIAERAKKAVSRK